MMEHTKVIRKKNLNQFWLTRLIRNLGYEIGKTPQ